jgi:hypothetical protein
MGAVSPGDVEGPFLQGTTLNRSYDKGAEQRSSDLMMNAMPHVGQGDCARGCLMAVYLGLTAASTWAKNLHNS